MVKLRAFTSNKKEFDFIYFFSYHELDCFFLESSNFLSLSIFIKKNEDDIQTGGYARANGLHQLIVSLPYILFPNYNHIRMLKHKHRG